MNFQLFFVDYLVIVLYLCLMLGVGGIFARMMKGGKDFFVGGRRIPWWAAGISLYMSLFSAWTFTGAASFTYNTGWFGVINFTLWPLALLIGFLMTAKRWRRTRVTSPVEYVKTRFNKPTHIFLSIVVIISSLYWPAHHLASLSKICAPAMFPNSMFAIDAMIVVVGLIILLYTFSGGLWAVAITDVVQFFIFIAICSVLIPVAFLSSDFGSIGHFLQKTPPLEFTHVIRGSTTYTYWYLIGIPLVFTFAYSSGANMQRYLSVRDEKAASKTGWLAFALFALSPILFGLPPLIGKVLWPDISTLSFLTNISKPDENVFIAVVFRYMPAGLVGLFLAAMMSASMSAMDSHWNAVSAIVSIDIYKTFFRPNASEKETLLVGRMTIVFLALLAIAMALMIIHSEYGVFTVSNIVLGLIGVPVSIPLFLGIVTRRISRWSAISSILIGTIVAALARFTLNYNIGPQYVVTVIITLLFLLTSQSLGRLQLRSRARAAIINAGMAMVLLLFFISVNSNPNLSFDSFSRLGQDGLSGLLSSSLFLTCLATGAILLLSQVFMKLYARDLLADQSGVDAFFQMLATPVDLEKEVGDDRAENKKAMQLTGWIAVGLSLMSLVMLLFPEGRSHIAINLAVFILLALTGGGMLLVQTSHDRRRPM